MKNILTTIFATLGLTLALSAQVKLGHVNSQEILTKLPDYKAAQTKAETFAKELEQSMQTMTAEYQKKLADLQKKEPTMTNTEKETAIADLQQLEQRIQQFQVSAQERMQKQENELLAPLYEKVGNAIKKVGEANSFTYIFDISAGATVYQNGTDVTPLVKKELGLQ